MNGPRFNASAPPSGAVGSSMYGEQAPSGSGGVDMGGLLTGLVNWQFLQEPAYRWALFVGMIILFGIAWHETLRFMRVPGA